MTRTTRYLLGGSASIVVSIVVSGIFAFRDDGSLTPSDATLLTILFISLLSLGYFWGRTDELLRCAKIVLEEDSSAKGE